ncbi:hypothetical protein B0H13DRAFT_1875462 [Mycena leptocephala]|nr:hypothetical protein B0H13DRAFT_1875462 [Mycena leptocephala]
MLHCQLSSACPAHARESGTSDEGMSMPTQPTAHERPIRETHPTPAFPPCSWRRARDPICGEMFVGSDIAERRPLPAQREHWTTGAGGQAVPSSASPTQRPETDAAYAVWERPLETRQLGEIIGRRVEEMGERGAGAVQSASAVAAQGQHDDFFVLVVHAMKACMRPSSNYEHIRIHEIQDRVHAKTHPLNERGAEQSRAEQLMAPEVNLELGTGAGNADVAGKDRARGGAAGAGSLCSSPVCSPPQAHPGISSGGVHGIGLWWAKIGA